MRFSFWPQLLLLVKQNTQITKQSPCAPKWMPSNFSFKTKSASFPTCPAFVPDQGSGRFRPLDTNESNYLVSRGRCAKLNTSTPFSMDSLTFTSDTVKNTPPAEKGCFSLLQKVSQHQHSVHSASASKRPDLHLCLSHNRAVFVSCAKPTPFEQRHLGTAQNSTCE